MLLPAVALAIGIGLSIKPSAAESVLPNDLSRWAAGGVLALGLGWGMLIFPRRPLANLSRARRGVAFVALVLTFGGLGALRAIDVASARPAVLFGAVRVSATLLEAPTPTARGVRVLCRLDSLHTPSGMVPYAGQYLLYADGSSLSHFTAGSRGQFEGVMSSHRDSMPAGYARYLYTRGIVGRFFMKKILRRMPPKPGDAWLRLSAALSARFDDLPVPLGHAPAVRAELRALILGDRSALTSEQKLHYARSGAAHVLAISGSHLSVLLAFVSVLIARLGGARHGRQRVWWSVALGGMLVAYALIAGGSPPVARAAIMAVMVLAADALYRRANLLNLLAASVLLQLLWHPPTLYDAGFQLSVSAVTGIVLCEPIWRRAFELRWRLVQAFLSLTAVTLSATLFTLPIVWFTFGQFPTWFLPANWVMVPLASAATVVGFLYLATVSIPGVGQAVGGGAAVLAATLDGCAQFFATLPGAAQPLPELSAGGAIGLLVLITLAALVLRRRYGSTGLPLSYSL